MGKGKVAPAYSQRQLRVGELIKQNIGEIFIRNEDIIDSKWNTDQVLKEKNIVPRCEGLRNRCQNVADKNLFN